MEAGILNESGMDLAISFSSDSVGQQQRLYIYSHVDKKTY